MNKLLLPTLIVAGLSSTASAFILDISSLIGQQAGTVTQNPYGNFQVQTTGDIVAFTDIVTNTNTGRAILDVGETLKVTYPSNVTYIGAFVGGNATAIDSGANVIYLSAREASTIDTITFKENAIPEPSSTALIGLGGIALLLRRRK